MSYLPEGMPIPRPTLDDAPYWEACRRGELVIRYCAACARHFHPPLPTCPRCGAFDVGWRKVSGRGTIYTWTVGHHPVHAALRGQPPYNVVAVLLDDADDVRIVSNVIDIPPEELAFGLPVEVVFEAASDGSRLPRFRRAVSVEGDRR